MKWLVLLPAWIFLLSYFIHRVREANNEALDTAEPGVEAGPVTPPAPPVAPEPPVPQILEPRPATLVLGEVESMGKAFARRVELLPVWQGEGEANSVSPLWPIDFEEGAGKARQGVDRWRLYQADGFSFYVPDAEGYQTVVLGAGEVPPMFGAIFHQADRAPDRWVVVRAADGSTWAAFAVDSAEEFDTGERYPAAEAFHKLAAAGGGIARASTRADGALARVQWMGSGVRISLLDWQHTTATRGEYRALASTLRLEDVRLADPESTLADLMKGAGFETRMGMLERGMDAREVEAILGAPVGIAGKVWVYHEPDRAGDRYYHVQLADGAFQGLTEDWKTVRKDPPIRGTTEWMLEKTEIRAGEPGGVGYDLGALTEEDTELIFAEIRNRLPSAAGDEWEDLCRVLANMAEMRLKDDEALKQLRARFLEPGLRSQAAILALRSLDSDGSRELFVQKTKDILGDLRWRSGGTEATGGPADDLQMLLAYIGKKHPEAAQLVRRTAEHPHAPVRAVGYSFWAWLDDEPLHALASKGLADSDPKIRRFSAVAFAEACGSAADLASLEARLRAEDDPEATEHLERAIARLTDVRAN